MKNAIIFLGIAALSLVLTLFTRAGARRLGVIAAPRKDRLHVAPTALLGGLAIYVTFMAAVFLF